MATPMMHLPPPEPPWPPAQPPPHMLLNEWKYEMRREAQEIIPGIFLGPFQASTSMDRLQDVGITHMSETRFIFPRFPTEFQYLTLDVADSGAQNIISIFPRCCSFIDEALNCGGAVLVHCNSGIATAPAIVMGYLMQKFGWEYTTALAYVQSKRYCVSPASFENQLREYAAIAMAQHAFATSPSPAPMGQVGHGDKRGYDDDGDGDGTGTNQRRRLANDMDCD